MAVRKSISKKLRFDVFKRDGFCCAYCGKKPPQTTLEVDHIDPVANGGGNSIDNLVTSCFECNRGKGKGLLSLVPESLKEKAKRIKECELQLSEYRKIIDAQDTRISSDVWVVIHELFDALVENDEHWDARSEVRCSGIETGLPCEDSRIYESSAVAAQMPDDSWVGWTYWYGGGKHAEPEAIDWIEYAHDLTCTEEEKVVVVRTFTK